MHYKIYTGWICPRNYYGSFCPNKTTAKKKQKTKNKKPTTIHDSQNEEKQTEC